jgi:hypothetical protein
VNRGLAATAAIVVSFALGTVIASHEAAAAGRQPTHVCSAVDRDFLETAVVQMTAFRLWSGDYLTGGGDAAEQSALTDEAARLIMAKQPRDRALNQARLLLGAMLVEYRRVVEAGGSFQRVRDLGVALRALLAEAGPALAREGCDVSPLL